MPWSAVILWWQGRTVSLSSIYHTHTSRQMSCWVTLIFHFFIQGEPEKGASGLFCTPPVRGDVWTSVVEVGNTSSLKSCLHFVSPCYIWSPLGCCWLWLMAEQPQKALSSLKSSWTNRKANLSRSINRWKNLKLCKAIKERKENVYKWQALITCFIQVTETSDSCFIDSCLVALLYFLLSLANCCLHICRHSCLDRVKGREVSPNACLPNYCVIWNLSCLNTQMNSNYFHTDTL